MINNSKGVHGVLAPRSQPHLSATTPRILHLSVSTGIRVTATGWPDTRWRTRSMVLQAWALSSEPRKTLKYGKREDHRELGLLSTLEGGRSRLRVAPEILAGPARWRGRDLPS
jgi:hypothetical protein